jgi:hypothetical protein
MVRWDTDQQKYAAIVVARVAAFESLSGHHRRQDRNILLPGRPIAYYISTVKFHQCNASD